MKIEILGSGCVRCDQLYKNATDAAKKFADGVSLDVEKNNDITYFAKMGVFTTPGLIIDGKVISVGKVLPVEEIRKKIEEKM